MSQTASAERNNGKDGSRPNVFARLALFFRQVIAELRKVNWPTRRELTTYTIVVVVFASIFAAIVLGLDLGLGKLMFQIFG